MLQAAFVQPWAQRGLIGVLTSRELSGRYRGSLLGHLWAFATPLLMLAVYTLVFGVILPSRWPGGAPGDDMLGFALRLLTGLLLHGVLAEALSRAPLLVVSQPNYVTKVVFPLEVLGWVNLLTAAVHAAAGLLLLVVVNGVWGAGFAPAQALLPLVLLPYLPMLLGLVWVVAALGVYVRDLAQIIGPAVMVLMFLGPVFYPREAIPEPLRGWLVLNPLTVPVEQARRLLFEHAAPDWATLAAYTFMALLVFVAGRAVFDLLRKGFADVL